MLIKSDGRRRKRISLSLSLRRRITEIWTVTSRSNIFRRSFLSFSTLSEHKKTKTQTEMIPSGGFFNSSSQMSILFRGRRRKKEVNRFLWCLQILFLFFLSYNETCEKTFFCHVSDKTQIFFFGGGWRKKEEELGDPFSSLLSIVKRFFTPAAAAEKPFNPTFWKRNPWASS